MGKKYFFGMPIEDANSTQAIKFKKSNAGSVSWLGGNSRSVRRMRTAAQLNVNANGSVRPTDYVLKSYCTL